MQLAVITHAPVAIPQTSIQMHDVSMDRHQRQVLALSAVIACSLYLAYSTKRSPGLSYPQG